MLHVRRGTWTTAVSLLICAVFVASHAMAQKKGGGGSTTPPPEGTVFAHYNVDPTVADSTVSMKADGSQKQVVGSQLGCGTFYDYGGHRWWIRSEVVGDGQVYPLSRTSTAEPWPRRELYARALDEAGNQMGERIQLTNFYPDAEPWSGTWSNGSDGFISLHTSRYEYDEGGYRTRFFGTIDKLDIAAMDVEAADLEAAATSTPPALTGGPATLSDERLRTVILNSDYAGQILSPVWSPDGHSLAIYVGTTVLIVDANTGEERLACELESNLSTTIDWSRTKPLLLVSGTPAGKARGLYTVDLSNPASTPQLVIASTKSSDYGWGLWSPDGDFICATRSNFNTWKSEVVRLNANGTGIISLWSGYSNNGLGHKARAWSTDRLAPALLP